MSVYLLSPVRCPTDTAAFSCDRQGDIWSSAGSCISSWPPARLCSLRAARQPSS